MDVSYVDTSYCNRQFNIAKCSYVPNIPIDFVESKINIIMLVKSKELTRQSPIEENWWDRICYCRSPLPFHFISPVPQMTFTYSKYESPLLAYLTYKIKYLFVLCVISYCSFLFVAIWTYRFSRNSSKRLENLRSKGQSKCICDDLRIIMHLKILTARYLLLLSIFWIAS